MKDQYLEVITCETIPDLSLQTLTTIQCVSPTPNIPQSEWDDHLKDTVAVLAAMVAQEMKRYEVDQAVVVADICKRAMQLLRTDGHSGPEYEGDIK